MFSICSKAPLVRAGPFSLRGRKRLPKKTLEEKGRKKEREKIARNGRGREEEEKREERDSCEEEKLGASAIYARITRVNGVGSETPREKKERE